MENKHININLQDGPIKENGVNGCQIDDVILWSVAKLREFNKACPSGHTSRAIGHLGRAVEELQDRRLDRTERGVEGTSAR